MNKAKVTIRVDEDKAIVTMIDQIAKAEGTTRTVIVRRFIRRGLGIFLPSLPENGNSPKVGATEQVA